MSQLALLPDPERGKVPAKVSKLLNQCRCGHHVDEHEKGARGAVKGCRVCGKNCSKFRSRAKATYQPSASVEPPQGAIVLMRPDTKQPKRMGWAFVHGPALVELYLEQLRTKSPNKTMGMWGALRNGKSRISPRAMFAMQAAANAKLRDRARAAVTQMMAADARWAVTLKPPSCITIGRVASSGGLDDDNLVAAMKHLVDGVALALGINDKNFGEGKLVDVVYRSEKPGKRGVYGVRIELEWP